MTENLQELLEHNWAMDSIAATELANRLEMSGQGHIVESAIEHLDPAAIARRDLNRELLGQACLGLGKSIIILGPCSETLGADDSPLFDLVDELQEEFPVGELESTEGVLIGVRKNGGKPRTDTKTRGLGFSTITEERQSFFTHHQQAFDRGLLTVTETLNGPQLGTLAPLISGHWLGMRDMLSTTLRDVASLIKLPVMVKNGQSGEPIEVKRTIVTIRSNSDKKDGSGADLGSIARSAKSVMGVDPGILPVGGGNNNVAIIARGYELPESMGSEDRMQAAFTHLGKMCLLADEMGCAVLLDGSHKVPHMFSIEASDIKRFISSTQKINKGIREGRVKASYRYKGGIHEIGVVKGRTDPDFLIETKADRELVKSVVRDTISTIIDTVQTEL